MVLLAPVRVLHSFIYIASTSASGGHPCPVQMAFWVCAGSVLTTAHSPQLLQPHSTVEICQRARMARAGAHLRLGLTLGFAGHWPESWAISACFICLVLGVSKCMHVCSSQTESKFLTVLLFVPLVFKPAKGTHLPGVRA